MRSQRWRLLMAMTVTLSLTAPMGAFAEPPEKLKLATLMRAALEGNDGTEVIVSHVEVPPNATLPWHWHPGEEFVYITDGDGVVTLKDEESMALAAGDVFKVPYKKIHAAQAGPKGFRAIVFRVHEVGQPERVLVDD